ncbi:helix-turn-helix transcriptional regulator [Sphingomonas aerolata]|uniref:helix-turn-helix transcriptional regulator n=1 Tax=Sphingomonas aerolata TaxID=185951 RepID=UPI002FE2E4BC
MVCEMLLQVELARRWRLSPRTLERFRYERKGPPYIKIGGRVVYRVADVETYERSGLVMPSSGVGGGK